MVDDRFDQVKLEISRNVVRRFLSNIPRDVLFKSFRSFENGSDDISVLQPDDLQALRELIANGLGVQ